jgi:hypothetical protein
MKKGQPQSILQEHIACQEPHISNNTISSAANGFARSLNESQHGRATPRLGSLTITNWRLLLKPLHETT